MFLNALLFSIKESVLSPQEKSRRDHVLLNLKMLLVWDAPLSYGPLRTKKDVVNYTMPDSC